MNIKQRCLKQIEKILISKDNEASRDLFSFEELEKFLNKIGDQKVSFFPTYPSLPKVKYLLWNHDNLKSELIKKIENHIFNLWISNKSVTIECKTTEPIPETIVKKSSKKTVPMSTKEKSNFSPTVSESAPFVLKRKQDGFDRLLDFVAMFVRIFTFS